ncbi:MAG: NUDIX hydrolase [Sphingomonadaceae bacterium]
MTAPAIPAATLILFRPGAAADEHLFVERAATMRFAGGATVFPGGRVDAGDRDLARNFPELDREDAAARIAAVRETIEEAGVAVGLSPVPDLATVEHLRAQLVEGRVFEDILAAASLRLTLNGLVPFARWCPNFNETRNFDTRFYLARLPADAHPARVDLTENVHLFWATAQAVLDRAEASELSIIFPTRRNLERLAMLATFEAASAQAARIPSTLIIPRIEETDSERRLVIPDGLGYPVTSEPLGTASRG